VVRCFAPSHCAKAVRMSAPGPVRLVSPSGLSALVNANGSIRRMDHRDVILNAFLGTEIEGGPTNLFLRRLDDPIEWIPLLGPRSPAEIRLDEGGFELEGTWSGLRFRAALRLADAAPAWFWHVELESAGGRPETFDLVYAQDVALADYAAVRLNEYYLSQYVDHTPLVHPTRGAVLAMRQNLAVGGRHPWALIGSLSRAASFATDALQLHGLATRAGRAPVGLVAPSLPGVRHQHEHSMAVIQDAPVRLTPGARVARGFFGWLEPDHPDATSADDLRYAERALALPEAAPAARRGAVRGVAPGATLFGASPLLEALELEAAELALHFGAEQRAAELDGDRLLSFFSGADAHVVLPAKERESLRPHGQILRSGANLVPDEASLTSTVWMGGVFHSMVTQGHVSINRLLSTTHGYLGLFRANGQRVFAELRGGWRLLDQPSAFEMTPSGARWLYKHAEGLIEVRSWAPLDRHELWLAVRIPAGSPCRLLVSHHVAVNGDDGADALPVRFSRDAAGIAIGLLPESELGRRFPMGGFRIDTAPGTALEQVGGDELLFEDGRSRGQPFLALIAAASPSIALRITGRLVDGAVADPAVGDAEPAPTADATASARFWKRMTGPLSLAPATEGPAALAVAQLAEILPWFARDALVHALAPRGLEQYSGGGWGTRDVCQGPVELLLALGRSEPVRELLLRVFRNQNPDGDWPQWFMFFERERAIRPADSHGDIVFWPLLALAQYLLASDDAEILDEALPFFHAEGHARAERATLLAHVERALALIARRVLPGTQLAVYGNGDWNDALQPADPALCHQLCSAWTVTLHHQTFTALAAALRHVGRAQRAAELEALLPLLRADFQRLLVVDGVVAGLARFPEEGGVTPWLHPSDRETGVRYSLLPMIHAILAGLFTREQALRHVALIRRHLLGVDGARLFDRPFPYRGGIQRHFQRAETSTFFGREIGLMYVHAHLRYAEAMARLGDADALLLALRQANPVGLRSVVPGARLRQANCYSSSSDADFKDRDDALARYDEVRTGAVAFEGGWRVYSSGAGIALRIVRECLLGLRLRRSELGIDPVLPRSLDGLRAAVEVAGSRLEVVYRVGPDGHGPRALRLDGVPLPFTRAENPYREGGALVAMGPLRERLRDGARTLVVELG
jgi:cellobiose phosphorylase